jgi:hypothetical protein
MTQNTVLNSNQTTRMIQKSKYKKEDCVSRSKKESDDEQSDIDKKIMKGIMKPILEINSSTIGQYKKTNLGPLGDSTEHIQASIIPMDYPPLMDAVKTLTNMQEVYSMFMNFCKTHEYIIHMHNKYKVNVHPGLSDESTHILDNGNNCS